MAIMKRAEPSGGRALRLDTAWTGGKGGRPGVAMSVGEPGAGDQLVKHQGDVHQYVSKMVSAAYDGCVLDLIETPEEMRFGLGPPEAGRYAS